MFHFCYLENCTVKSVSSWHHGWMVVNSANRKLVISFLSDRFEDFTRDLLKYIVFEMILYLRIHVIFWMITESSSCVLISAFPNNVTSVLDGDLPTEVAPARACAVSDGCSNNAVRCSCVNFWLLLLQTEQASASCREGKNNQSVCGECSVD